MRFSPIRKTTIYSYLLFCCWKRCHILRSSTSVFCLYISSCQMIFLCRPLLMHTHNSAHGKLNLAKRLSTCLILKRMWLFTRFQIWTIKYNVPFLPWAGIPAMTAMPRKATQPGWCVAWCQTCSNNDTSSDVRSPRTCSKWERERWSHIQLPLYSNCWHLCRIYCDMCLCFIHIWSN